MQDIPYGHCHCGCGQKTEIAQMTQAACGWIKGEPKRYVFNHHRRLPTGQQHALEDLGYDTPCWVWQGSTRDGYGRIWRNGKLHNASRWFYEQTREPIPEGMHLDHLCHRKCDGGTDCPHRRCVNPDHLEPVTHTVNIRRGVQARGKSTHCKHGHEYTPENTYERVNGSWTCKTCRKRSMLAYYYRERAKSGAKRT